MADFIAGSTDSKVIAGEGAWHTGNLLCGGNIHILTIVVTNNFNSTVAFVSKEFRAPLAESVTGYTLSVAVRRKNRLGNAGTCQIVIKYLVYQVGNIFKNISAVYKFLVVGCGRGDGKVITLITIKFRKHTIKGKGHNHQNVR